VFYNNIIPPTLNIDDEEYRYNQEAAVTETLTLKPQPQSKIYAPKTGSYLESFKLKQELLKQEKLAHANASAPDKLGSAVEINGQPDKKDENQEQPSASG
jgi:hypothetical protein